MPHHWREKHFFFIGTNGALMTTYFTMASLTLVLVLTWALHAASFTLYQQEETNYQMTPISHPEYESARKCIEDERKRSANCRHLKLRGVPDYLLPNVQILSLEFNSLRNLNNSSFLSYRQLRHLNVSFNNIKNIEAATFQPLKYLLCLDISSNQFLESLHPDIISLSQSLSTLIAKHCHLNSFPQNTTYVQHLNQVNILMLDRNTITHINISCDSENHESIDLISLKNNKFKELTHQTFRLDCDVNKLDLSNNRVMLIDSNTIATLRVQSFLFGGTNIIPSEVWRELIFAVALSRIKYLSLNSNGQGILDPHFFSPLRNHSLFSLQIYSVDISDYIDTIFTDLHFVSELIARSYIIPLLKPTYFSGMHKLKTLDLKNNEIEKINSSSATWSLIYLRELYLCGNRLYEITPNTFQGLSNLSMLDLADNEKLEVFTLSGSELYNLQHLNVSGTSLIRFYFVAPSLISITSSNMQKIFAVPGETFNYTRSLESLDLTNSNVKPQQLWNSYRNLSLFDSLNNLTYLSLRINPVIKLVSGLFHNLFALEFLDLSNCQITIIQAETFQGLISLHTLKLEYNYIQQLPANLFIDLKNLLTCSLTRNNLNYLDNQTFASTKSLKSLLLAFNQFTYFNRSTLEPIFATARSIDISHNPINCNCELTWLVDWLKGPVDVLNETICSTGSGTLAPLRGKPLLTFIPNELCGLNILLVSLVPLAAIGLIASLFVLHHYRWYVRFKLYLVKLAVLGYEEVLDAREHGDFEFDLNIMFLEDDAQWVVEYLKPVLEERLPHFNRNAIGDDDLILGMHYLDAVYYVIEKSFKTVILLSRAAVKENWFMIKFRIAFEHVNDDRMENLVLVFLEDIPDAEIPFLVRLYLSERRTYLEWVEDERGQDYFWEELILTLQRDIARWNNVIPPE